jgi:hypothetical protein
MIGTNEAEEVYAKTLRLCFLAIQKRCFRSRVPSEKVASIRTLFRAVVLELKRTGSKLNLTNPTSLRFLCVAGNDADLLNYILFHIKGKCFVGKNASKSIVYILSILCYETKNYEMFSAFLNHVRERRLSKTYEHGIAIACKNRNIKACEYLLRHHMFSERNHLSYCSEELIKYNLANNNLQELYNFVVHCYENTSYRLNSILAQKVLGRYKDAVDDIHKYLVLLQYISDADVLYETLRSMLSLNAYWKFQLILIMLQKRFVGSGSEPMNISICDMFMSQEELFLQALVDVLMDSNVVINTQHISQKAILYVLSMLPKVDEIIPYRAHKIAMRDIAIGAFPISYSIVREGRYFLF